MTLPHAPPAGEAERFRWLASQKFNAFHLERNGDHACNYMTAAEWIESNPDDFSDLPEEALQQMRDTNTIWRLQIYPSTPVGFVAWSGPTAEYVIDAAMQEFAMPPTPGAAP